MNPILDKLEQAGSALKNPISRRDALKVMGCTLCVLALPKLGLSQESVTPIQAVKEGELTENGSYNLVTVDGKSALVYASDQPLENSVQWGALWLVAFSRYCTHRGAKLEEPSGGTMHCPRHGQDFEVTTGNPVGEKDKTRTPLEQYALEVRSDQTVWIIGIARAVE
jgi:Rieske Fe-S protein